MNPSFFGSYQSYHTVSKAINHAAELLFANSNTSFILIVSSNFVSFS